MVSDLKVMTDQEEIQQNITKYTECFDMLDRLGADNCVDPDDFDEEDMDDELFKNLQIKDIEELFKEKPKRGKTPIDQDSPAIQCSGHNQTPNDCVFNHKLESNKFFLSEEDALLLDRDDSPGHQLEDELNCMDFEQQMKMYEEMNENDPMYDDLNKPRNSCKDDELFNKFKIQGLEEVTERSEESDITSNNQSYMSYNNIDLDSSSDNNKSFDAASDHDTNIRIKIIDELE